MGAVTFGREIDAATSFVILDYALTQGLMLFDTVAAYGDDASESVLGQSMSSRGVRDKIVLATKVNGVLPRDFILRSAEEILRTAKRRFTLPRCLDVGSFSATVAG